MQDKAKLFKTVSWTGTIIFWILVVLAGAFPNIIKHGERLALLGAFVFTAHIFEALFFVYKYRKSPNFKPGDPYLILVFGYFHFAIAAKRCDT